MEKSRLGISINLFAALLYFLGAGGGMLVIAVAACYVLLFESNEGLKKTAVKALIVTVFLSIITSIVMWLTSFSSTLLYALNSYSSLSGGNLVVGSDNYFNYYLFEFIQRIISSINQIARVVEIIILVIFGFRAYKEKDIKIKWIDNIIDNHL